MSLGDGAQKVEWGPDAIEGKAGRFPWQPSKREPPKDPHLQGAWRWREPGQGDMGPPTPKAPKHPNPPDCCLI